MFGFIKNWFRKRNNEKKIAALEPWSCPSCGSKIELRKTEVGGHDFTYEDGRRIRLVNYDYVCVGLKDRAEVEEFLKDIWPGPVIPPTIIAKLPCGWSGLASDFPEKWS